MLLFLIRNIHDYLLVWNVDAEAIGAGKLIQMASAVGAVLEFISCISAVFFPITHKVQRHTTWVTRVPDWAGELRGAAGSVTWRTFNITRNWLSFFIFFSKDNTVGLKHYYVCNSMHSLWVVGPWWAAHFAAVLIFPCVFENVPKNTKISNVWMKMSCWSSGLRGQSALILLWSLLCYVYSWKYCLLPHCSSGASSLLSPQSKLPSQTIDWDMQFPLVQANWPGLHVLIMSSAHT